MFDIFKVDQENEAELWANESEIDWGMETEQWDGEEEFRHRRGNTGRRSRPISARQPNTRQGNARTRPSRQVAPRPVASAPGARRPGRPISRPRRYGWRTPVVYEPVFYPQEPAYFPGSTWFPEPAYDQQPVDGQDPSYPEEPASQEPVDSPGSDSQEPNSQEPIDADEIGHALMQERNISLKWFSKAGQGGDRFLFTLEEARKAVRADQGGVYIMIGDAKPGSKKPGGVCASCTKDCVLKVGIAEEFRSRFASYLAPGNRWPNQCSWGNLRVYMADIGGFYSLDRYVERALDRLLRKHGYSLPGGRPVKPQRVNSKVVIHNVLPTQSALLANVRNKVAQNRLPLDSGTSYEFGGSSRKPCSCQSVKTCSCQSGRGCSCKSGSTCSCQSGGQRAPSGKSCSCKSCSGRGGGIGEGCRNCGSTPCQCGSTCGPSCSCGRCKKTRAGITSGQWLRRGNKLQVMGVRP